MQRTLRFSPPEVWGMPEVTRQHALFASGVLAIPRLTDGEQRRSVVVVPAR